MPPDDSPDRSTTHERKRWLEWGRHRFPLTVGTHVVGRDLDAGIRLNASTVSRHHARLIVTPTEVRLEDLASKNGTFHDGDRIGGSIVLADGDALAFGDVRVTFHAADPEASAETGAVPLP